jgi:hypothetical protein
MVRKYCDIFAQARNVEPGEQPLLENGSETTFLSRQRPRNRQRIDVRY